MAGPRVQRKAERAGLLLTEREISDLRAVKSCGSSRQMLQLVDKIVAARVAESRGA